MIQQPGAMTIYQPSEAASVVPAQAHSDEHLIALWLHGRPATTARAYRADAREFLAHAGVPIRGVTLGAVQSFVDSLAAMKPASRARKVSSIKSLLTFAHRLGYVTFNVGAAVKPPAIKNQLAERILDEGAVHRLIALEPDARNAAMLRLIYGAGLRISEAASLCWRDLQPRDDAGQVAVFGKGGKTRVVLLPASLWRALVSLRGEASPDDAVFASAKGGALDRSQVHRIVKAAAARAGLSAAVSAHWLRHAHVSHALDRGAPAHLVQQTVGHASLATTSRYAHARPGDSSARYLSV